MSVQKDNIYNAAAILFRDKGYKATSMRTLATAVGLEVSSLYSHIRSKEEILQDICLKNVEHFNLKMQDVMLSNTTNTEKLKALIEYHVQVAMEDVTSVTIFNNEWRNLSEPHLSSFLENRKNYERQFMDIIKDGIEQGEFSQIDPTVTFYMIFTSIRWIHFWYKPSRSLTQTAVIQNVIAMIFNGLSPK